MPIVVAILVIVGLSGLRIAQEYQRGVVFRLGRYVGLRGPGLYWIIPPGNEGMRTAAPSVRADYLAPVFARALTPASSLPRCACQHSPVLPDAKTDDGEGEQPVSLTEQLPRSLVWPGQRIRYRTWRE